MSHCPVTSRSRATDSAVAPDEQAVHGARLGPVARSWIAISAAGMFGMVSRMPDGEVAPAPSRSSTTACSVSEAEPPLLVPTTTATLLPSHRVGSSPASVTASRAARTASFTYFPMRKDARLPIAASRSMPSTMQAKSIAHPSSPATVRAGDTPAHTPRQVDSVSLPTGVIMPSPVTATAGLFIGRCSSLPRRPPAPRCGPPCP